MIILILFSHAPLSILSVDSRDSTDIIKLIVENCLHVIFQLHVNVHVSMDEDCFISVALNLSSFWGVPVVDIKWTDK